MLTGGLSTYYSMWTDGGSKPFLKRTSFSSIVNNYFFVLFSIEGHNNATKEKCIYFPGIPRIPVIHKVNKEERVRNGSNNTENHLQ